MIDRHDIWKEREMARHTQRMDAAEHRQPEEGGTAFVFRDARLLSVEAEVSPSTAPR
jgi:hypothetical protein